MRFLPLAVIAAFAADLITTGIAFSMGASEANPLMADWPFWKILAAKIAVLAGVLVFSWKPSKWGNAVLWYGVVTTASVAAWNTYGIIRYGVLA